MILNGFSGIVLKGLFIIFAVNYCISWKSDLVLIILCGTAGTNILCGNSLLFIVKDLQRKAARIVASKCALAARVDSFHESPLGEAGKGQIALLIYYSSTLFSTCFCLLFTVHTNFNSHC